MTYTEFVGELERTGFREFGLHISHVRKELESFLEETQCFVAAGASRIVFVPEYEDWVVKVDRVGKKLRPSFCARELDFWEKACAADCVSCLAPVLGSGELGEFGWLAQRKVVADFDSEYSVEQKSIDFAENQLDTNADSDEIQDYADNLDAYDQIVAVCGDFELAQLAEELGLNDCHSGNWGWNDNSELVLFDFAGWF